MGYVLCVHQHFDSVFNRQLLGIEENKLLLFCLLYSPRRVTTLTHTHTHTHTHGAGRKRFRFVIADTSL